MPTVAAKRLFRTFQEARQKKSYYQRVREHRGYVPIRYESDDFLVTTAQTGPELFKVLELRHEVFVAEWQGRRAFHGLDVDAYDFMADHLMIIDKRVNETIGTYRLLSSHFTHNFYSSSEFLLTEFLRTPAVKLEMGRACIHPSHRNGNTMDLLWKGLVQYIQKTKTEYLFGCSSVKSTDVRLIQRMLQSFDVDEQWSDEYQIRPTWDYQYPDFLGLAGEALSVAERREFLPPLLRSYLNAGAKVYGWPALDRDFACTDLLTILDWKHLHPRFQSRFVVRS